MSLSLWFQPGARFIHPVRALGLIMLLSGLALIGTGHATAQTPPASGKVAPSPAAARSESRPAWNDLSAAQQAALQPLAPVWKEIDANRKRKWIALSANFGTMPATDQATLHGRMKEWAALSPAERVRARLNFAQTRELASDDKKAQWEAYQALSPEQKRQLAAQASKPTGAAPAATNESTEKLAHVPITRSDRKPSKNRPAPPDSPVSAPAASRP